MKESFVSRLRKAMEIRDMKQADATEKMAEQSVEIFEKVTKENLPTK